MRRWFQRIVLPRPWVLFIVLVVSFLAFGGGTVNLFYLLHANLELIATHGWMALADGALQQLAEILLTAGASMVAYLVFKTCESRLVHWLINKDESPT